MLPYFSSGIHPQYKPKNKKEQATLLFLML